MSAAQRTSRREGWSGRARDISTIEKSKIQTERLERKNATMASKTALDIDPSKWDQYQPFVPDVKAKSSASPAKEAYSVAKKIAEELVKRFGAKKVVLFGSLARGDFNRWSDIDLAVWGIPAAKFFKAVSFASGISDLWRVDLVDSQDCTRALREIILEEGTEL